MSNIFDPGTFDSGIFDAGSIGLLTADAIIRREYDGEAIASSWVFGYVENGLTSDAIIAALSSVSSVTVDALVRVPRSGQLTADAIRRRTMSSFTSASYSYSGASTLLTSTGATEVIIAGCDLTVPGNVQVGLAWNIWYSHSQNGVVKHEYIYLRRDGLGGAVLATSNPQTGGDGGDSTAGHQFNAVGTYTDTSPTTGHYVVTIRSDQGNPALYSNSRVFSATGVGASSPVTASGIVFKTASRSFTADAWPTLRTDGSFTAGAFIIGRLYANAIIRRYDQPGSLTVDAWPVLRTDASFTAGSFVRRTIGDWDGLVLAGGQPSLWWKINESSGSILDYGTYNQPLTNVVNVTRPVGGYVDKAASFAGNGYATGASYALAVGNVLTVEAWVYPTSASRMTILGSNNVAGVIQLEMSATRQVSAIINTVYVATSSTNDVALNQWNHIVYTRSGTGAGTHKIYVNGTLRTLTVNASNNFVDSASVKLLGARTTGSQLWSGRIDEVIVYPRVLSASEVAAHAAFLPKSVSADAVIFRSTAGSVSASAVVKRTAETVASLDAELALYVARHGSLTADAVLLAIAGGSITADAAVSFLVFGDLTSGAIFRSPYIKTLGTAAAVFKVVGKSKSVAAGAHVIELPRSRHARDGDQHHDPDLDTVIVLATALDIYTSGMTVHDVLVEIEARLTALEETGTS